MKRYFKVLVVMISISLLLGLVSIVGFAAGSPKVTLSIWDWNAPRMDVTKPYLEKYQQLHPNVVFETQVIMWGNYWEKMISGVAAKVVPDICAFHNAKTAIFLPALEPFPESLFPLDKMRKEYFSLDPANIFDGKLYYLPGWLMTGIIYYNVDMLEKTDLEKLPTTWEELREAAKKLTVYDEKGNVIRAGFQFMGEGNLQWIWYDLNYQQGGWIYNEAKTGVELNTPSGLKALKYLCNLALKDKVTAPGFLGPLEAFGTEKAAMVYLWTWGSGYLDYNYPELKWGVFPLPTEFGENLPARGRNNYECGYAVPKAGKHKDEAFKFLKWLWDQDDFMVKLCITMGSLPGNIELWEDPNVKADKTLSVLTKIVPYTVFPGELPPWLTDEVMSDLETRVIIQDISPEKALETAQKEADSAFKGIPVKWIVERQYQPLEQ